MATTDNQTTKAIEWAVERISAASQSGWWIDRISQLSGSTSPAYKTAAPAAPSMPAAAAVPDAVYNRLSRLEAELADLKKRHEELATHLEEAVGPSSEGAHKQHWWSRKG